MERDQELLKLVNVLRRTGRMASQAHWTGAERDAAGFCAQKYNRVLARLTELDESVGAVFEPLAPESSLTVTAIACRQLAAYYEDELDASGRFREAAAQGFAVGPIRIHPGRRFKRACRDLWSEAGGDIEDLGEFIRESINEWTRHRGHRKEDAHAGPEPEASGAKS